MINDQGDEKKREVGDGITEGIHCCAWFWLKHKQSGPADETSAQHQSRNEIKKATHSGEEWEDAYNDQHQSIDDDMNLRYVFAVSNRQHRYARLRIFILTVDS